MRIFFPLEGAGGFIATSLHLTLGITGRVFTGSALSVQHHRCTFSHRSSICREALKKTLYLNRSAVKREGRGSCHQ
jgi:hypothetical protein